MSQMMTVEGYHLENRTGNSSKFYTVLIADNGVVVLNWGRIGTQGQSKIQSLPSRADAEAVGKRQVYSKQTRGYMAVADAVKFTVETVTVEAAASNDAPHRLLWAFGEARTSPQFEGEKESVTSHYDDLLVKAQALMDGASDRDFGEVVAEYEELKSTWAEISNKHDQTKITLELTEQMLGQRIMSGAL